MKKVLAIIGTQARKATYLAVQEFEKQLKAYQDIDFEYLFLSDYHLEFCQDCKVCFLRGEEYCPLKDDRNILVTKMEHADGVIFATPNYVLQVSARMKNFLDRLAYCYHRPRFFGKAATAIVTQGVFGGGPIVKYLLNAGQCLGFHTSPGCSLTTLDPLTQHQEEALRRKIKKAAASFHRELLHPAPPPSLFRLLLFRMARTGIKHLDESYRDYCYYREKGWFTSPYFYPTSLGPFKTLAGHLFDFLGHRLAKHMQ